MDVPRAMALRLNKELEAKSKMKLGKTLKHPDGRTVKITGGAFLRNGRVSNFWTWREVLPSGKLGKEEDGYGW